MGSGARESAQGRLFEQVEWAATHHKFWGFATLMRPSRPMLNKESPC
jgi:hypothetical protein